MKKFLFSVAIVATIAGSLMTSCKKEQETVFNSNEQTVVNDPQNDAEVNRILDFKNKVDERKLHPGMRSGETMTLEEAMNNIVDLFNVTYTEPMECYTSTENQRFSIRVPLAADGKILVDEVVAAYEQAVEEAREVYHASTFANKGYRRLMVSCEIQRDGEVSLDFNGQFGSKTDHPQPPIPNPHYVGPFQEGDDWHYLYGMGSCDGTRLGGADRMLQDTLMQEVRAQWPVPYDGGRGVFTHLVTIDFAPTEQISHNVFYRNDIEATCIEWQEMNDLLHYERELVFEVIPSGSEDPVIVLHPTNAYNFRDYVTSVTIQGEGNNTTFIRHKTIAEYGRYLYIGNIFEYNEL